jgi:hypothetical protein
LRTHDRFRLPLPARGERSDRETIRVRGRFCERSGNNFQNAVCILQHINVPKTKDSVLVLLQPLVPQHVASAFCVLAAIDLNHQSLLATYEIDNIWPDRLLPYKLEITKRPRSQFYSKAATPRPWHSRGENVTALS